MGTFNYTVIGKDGKQQKGSLEADTKDLAIGELKSQGNTIISLEEANALNSNVNINIGGKPSARDMSVFCRQFVSIVDAGVPVISALGMLSEQTSNKRLTQAIIDCKKAIEKGSTLADAMAEHPDVFSRIFVTLVRAGEESGALSQSFDRMGKQFEKEHALKAIVRKASIYPIILLTVTFIVIVVLLVMVVPQFKEMLSELGAKMPAITVFVLGASDFMKHYWFIILSVVAAIFVTLKLIRTNKEGAYRLDQLRLKLPGKTLATKQNTASFTRTLATLLATGIPMIDALNIVAGTMKNLVFEEAVYKCREAVSMGSSLATPLKENGVFPPLVHHMVGIGEDTGNIDGMLDKVADYYDEEVKEATEQLVALMEPIMILILAAVVGSIVFSIVLPMAAMVSALDNI